jgi:hypothetical protein
MPPAAWQLSRETACGSRHVGIAAVWVRPGHDRPRAAEFTMKLVDVAGVTRLNIHGDVKSRIHHSTYDPARK